MYSHQLSITLSHNSSQDDMHGKGQGRVSPKPTQGWFPTTTQTMMLVMMLVLLTWLMIVRV